MLRYRRYRAFLVFAVFAVFGVYYYFASDGSWQPSSISTPSLKQLGSIVVGGQDKPQAKLESPNKVSEGLEKPIDLGGERKPDAAPKSKKPVPGDDEDDEEKPSDLNGQEKDHSKSVTTPGKGTKADSSKDPAKGKYPSVEDVKSGAGKPDQHKPKIVVAPEYESNPGSGRQDNEYSQGRPEETVHWSKQPEHFPVSSTIALPTASPKAIPKIQHTFKKETEAEKTDRLKKLAAIKKLAQHAWAGYRAEAWGHDEVRPITGGWKSPFGGWAATLVDSLDTLWIMGMKEEFEEAVAKVAKIDFTTCSREDIPLFETTIRYLGGMLSAYDISGAKHKVLLDKAVELGEVLIGAFDTPNRMPVTFYYWKPAYASQPHRAGSSVVMAELGSLSMEFTRLAQLTKENKYYDAIDRVTDAFVEWQTRETNQTWLPGMFSLDVDASGCDTPQNMNPSPYAVLPPQEPLQMEDMPKVGVPKGDARMDMGETGLSQKPKNVDTSKRPPLDDEDAEDTLDASSKPLHMGEPGRSKIVGWNDPLKEGALDSKAAKEKLLAGKESELGSSSSKGRSAGASDKKAVADDAPSEKLKAAVPATVDTKLDEKVEKNDPKEVDSLDSSSLQRRKRQLGGSLSDEAEEELSSAAKTTTSKDTETVQIKKKKPSNSDAELLTGANDNVPVGAGAGAHGHGQLAPEHLRTPPVLDEEHMQVCNPQNLTSSVRNYGRDKFTLGGRADSTYEYFPKQYLLLGGLEKKYQELYERSIDVATKYLLFRPQTPENHDILLPGDWDAWKEQSGEINGTLSAESGHLACFAGGMYALGAKIFDRPNDLKIAAKLTQGCVWAYQSTKTGIMPEWAEFFPCEDKKNCEWNKTAYYEALDPYRESRESMYNAQPLSVPLTPVSSFGAHPSNNKPSDAEKGTTKDKDEALDMGSSDSTSKAKTDEKSRDKTLSKSDAKNPQNIADDDDAPVPQNNPQKISDDFKTSNLRRRQLSEEDEISPVAPRIGTTKSSVKSADDDEDEDDDEPTTTENDNVRPGSPVKYAGEPAAAAAEPATTTDALPQPEYTPPPPPTHEEYVKSRIEEERLPPGFLRINSREYILRPEAIESVWYMYRITGDVHWRKVGWTMFTAISDHTSGVYGNSAIDDVTKSLPMKKDSQESFWLAETLKYFFLLFSDESVVSLDEWVLNTEAHPFKRPLPQKKS
ncbi:putative glycosyl hydrolase family 47 protein 2 [Elsinoe fawcettii]|nr:putative glycosyl hydrolase family 47 protein 2 [Elsinoe fawcettii]